MAENEIVKHTKKAITIIKSPGKGFKHKLGEIFVEIIIIVIAVNVSIWFNNWSEKQHDKKEEKEFFIGLKQDLQGDIENMTNSEKYYESTLQGIRYFLKAKEGKTLSQDSINSYSDAFFGSTDLDPHIGRYEGLKSSGKFKIIENKELLNEIIDFHESVIQRIQDLNEKYYRHNEKIANLISQNAELAKNGQVSNVSTIINRSDFRILIGTSWGLIANNIVPIHKTGIRMCNEIIAEIDKELK
jgi:hypothetical protein